MCFQQYSWSVESQKKLLPSSVWNKNLTNFFFIFRIVENIYSVYTIEAFCSALFLWTLRKIYSSLYVNLAPPLRHWSLKVSFAVFLYLLLAYQKKYSQSSVEPFCVSWCNIWIRWLTIFYDLVATSNFVFLLS